MRHLLVIGATGIKCPPVVTETIKNALYRWPDYVHYAETREDAAKMLDTLGEGNFIVAYAPGVFGDAVAGKRLSPYLYTDEPQIVLTTSGYPRDWLETDDPRQHLESAMAALKVNQAFNVESSLALDLLHGVLGGEISELAF